MNTGDVSIVDRAKAKLRKGRTRATNRVRSGPIVETSEGPVRGHLIAKGRIAHFAAIPYAAAPTGNLRWRPPVRPVHRGEHILDCIKTGPIPFQRALLFDQFLSNLLAKQGLSSAKVRAMTMAAKAVPVRESEDSLSLNVRSPAGATNLPVMVWIHGGDQTDGSGSDPLYATNGLAARGCVLVTINYRLGVFGWMAHPELEAESPDHVSGNYGLLDQISALEWVRDNIAEFGGDPDRVTIFGESAGGQGVLNLMTAPRARGLFHRAIAQSPSDSGRWLHGNRGVMDLRAARDAGHDFCSSIVGTAPGQLARMRALPAGDINEHYRTDEEAARHFYPNVDGVILPTTPMTAFSLQQQAPVPLIVGYNSDEGSLLADFVHPAGGEFGGRPEGEMDRAEIRESFERSYGSAEAVDALFASYPGLADLDERAIEDHFADHMFGVHADHASRQHAAGGHPVWRYFFQAKPALEAQTAGAFHAADVLYVFDSSFPMLPVAPDAHLLSADMGDRWFAFAATGTPDYPGRETWPQFDPQTSPKQVVFDRPRSEVQSVPESRGLDVMRARIQRLSDALNPGSATDQVKVTNR